VRACAALVRAAATAAAVAVLLAGCDMHTGSGRDSRASAPAPSHGPVDDVGITAAIHARLIVDAELKSRRIDVDTRDGHVLLQGRAPSAAARDRAAQLAADTAGVRSVDNRVAVALP
jgi:hyperosmotically inducible periplasmic protein